MITTTLDEAAEAVFAANRLTLLSLMALLERRDYTTWPEIENLVEIVAGVMAKSERPGAPISVEYLDTLLAEIRLRERKPPALRLVETDGAS